MERNRGRDERLEAERERQSAGADDQEPARCVAQTDRKIQLVEPRPDDDVDQRQHNGRDVAESKQAPREIVVVRQRRRHRDHRLECVERHHQTAGEPEREHHEPTADVPRASHDTTRCAFSACRRATATKSSPEATNATTGTWSAIDTVDPPAIHPTTAGAGALPRR